MALHSLTCKGKVRLAWSAELACIYIAGEDLWHCYNLIRDGDHVTATTFRKVARDSGAGSESEKVRLRLTIAVEGVDFDPEGAHRACVGSACCWMQCWHQQQSIHLLRGIVAESMDAHLWGNDFCTCLWTSAMVSSRPIGGTAGTHGSVQTTLTVADSR